MSEHLWYYIDNTQAQQGPITIPQLQELVASHVVIPSTTVWTEALGDQWIPASNVEGLFAPEEQVKPDPNTASVAVSAPSRISTQQLASEIAHAPAPPAPTGIQAAPEQPQQPQVAPTTPMIPSTPTTKPVAGTAVPIPGHAAQAEQPAPVASAGNIPVDPTGAHANTATNIADGVGAVAAAVDESADTTAPAEVKQKSMLGIILLILGLGVAGYGGYQFSVDGGTNLSYGLLGGGGLFAIIGLILTLKGKKAPAPLPISASTASALGGLAGIAPAVAGGDVHPGTLDLSAVADVKPIPAGTAPVAIKAPANPLLGANAPAAAPAADKPSPFAGVHAATRPNPLLANAAAAKPQNKLNTSLPATPAAPAEASADNPS